MMQYVGLDVSMRETKLHVLDQAGQRLWRLHAMWKSGTPFNPTLGAATP
jgi:hypothetical protein